MEKVTVTPGIQRLVDTLREFNFDTVDSGDGVTNVAAGMEGALPFPHVVIATAPDYMVADARALKRTLELIARRAEPSAKTRILGARIEATYSPIDNTALIMLYDLDDVGAGLATQP